MAIIRWRLLASACLCLCTLGAQAQIYKWTDAGGKVHYTNNRDEAGGARTETVKAVAPPADQAKTPPAWQQQEADFKRRNLDKQRMQAPVFRAPEIKQGRAWGPGEPDNDKTRCNLALDIRDGLVRHRNGNRLDANDREIAARDIGSFCH